MAEKTHGNSISSGRADIIGCYRGRMLRIEVKTPDHRNEASSKQLVNLRRWKRSGAITMVVYSLSAVKLFLSHDAISHPEKYKPGEEIHMIKDEPKGTQSWAKFRV